MIPWIQVYSNLPTHDKTYNLATALKITKSHAVGLMVCLWLWASVNASDGDITGYPPDAIADAAGWKKSATAFYKTLLDVRLIEQQDDRVIIRNWEQYALLLMDLMDDQKRKTNERVRKHREKKKAAANKAAETPPLPNPDNGEKSRNGNAAETLHGVTETPLHNQTQPNTTLPDLPATLNTGEKNNNLVVDDVYARMSAETENIKIVIGTYIGDNVSFEQYFGMSEQIKEAVDVLTNKLFSSFALRSKITDTDRYKVFLSTFRQNNLPDGTWNISFPSDSIDLLCYAFEQAINAGCPGNWKYIEGVLGRLYQRGIRTLEQAHRYDIERHAM